MTGIADLFASLDGSDRYEMQLELWCHFQRSASSRRARESERRNRERHLARRRERYRQGTGRDRATVAIYNKNWLARKPEGTCRQCPAQAVAGKKLCQPHLDRAVAYQMRSRTKRVSPVSKT